MFIFLDIKRGTDCSYTVQNECSEQVISALCPNCAPTREIGIFIVCVSILLLKWIMDCFYVF